MPVATPDPDDPFDSGALRRAIEQMADLQMGPVRRAAEQMADLQMGPVRRAAERAAALNTVNYSAVISNALGPVLTRSLAVSFASLPTADLVGVWREANSFGEETPHTESVLSRLQVDVPSLPPNVLVCVVVCFVWLVSMGLLSTVSFENSDSAKEFIALTGLSPAVVSTALAGWSGYAVKQWQQRARSTDDPGE